MLKDLGGRPLKFKTPKILQEKCEAYFKSCWRQKVDMFGNPIFAKKVDGSKDLNNPVMEQFLPYIITGLAVFLGTTRETLLDYQHGKRGDKYSYTIKKAKEMCKAYAEQSLFIGKNPTGAMFNLKNNYDRWEDKTKSEHSGSIDLGAILDKAKKEREQKGER